jgi:hypothetical protein
VIQTLNTGHREILNLTVGSAIEQIKERLIEDIVRPLLVWNFGEDVDDFGEFLSDEKPEENAVELLNALNSIVFNGTLSAADLDVINRIRTLAGIPTVSEIVEGLDGVPTDAPIEGVAIQPPEQDEVVVEDAPIEDAPIEDAPIEDAQQFKAAPKGKAIKKKGRKRKAGKKNCTKGRNCGKTCIAAARTCRIEAKQISTRSKTKAKKAKVGGGGGGGLNPENVIILGDLAGYAAALDEALNSIPGAGDRVAKLRKFANDNGVKVVVNTGPPPENRTTRLWEKGKGQIPIEQIGYMADTAGYTYEGANHIVLQNKGNPKYTPQYKLDTDRVYDAADLPIGDRPFIGVSAQNKNTNLYDYLHEMGHQIDYKTRRFDEDDLIAPVVGMGTYKAAPTRYGSTNKKELFAESFALYMLNKDRFKDTYPDLHDWVDRKLNWANS